MTWMVLLSRSLSSVLDAGVQPSSCHAIVGTGERLGFYAALARLESTTAVELAMAAHASAWFAEAWLQAQARAGYAVYTSETDRYSLFCRIDEPDSTVPSRYAES